MLEYFFFHKGVLHELTIGNFEKQKLGHNFLSKLTTPLQLGLIVSNIILLVTGARPTLNIFAYFPETPCVDKLLSVPSCHIEVGFHLE